MFFKIYGFLKIIIGNDKLTVFKTIKTLGNLMFIRYKEVSRKFESNRLIFHEIAAKLVVQS